MILSRLNNKYKSGDRINTTLVLTLLSLTLLVVNFFAPFLGLNEVSAQLDIDSLVELHNVEREKEGLKPLKISPELNASATQKAQAMLESDCWSHYCPDGKSPWDFFEAANYDYVFAGENLAEGFYSNASVIKAWMGSKSHKANILNEKFSEVGFGFARGDFQNNQNNVIIVVHFGHRDRDSIFTNLEGEEGLSTPEILSPTNESYTSSNQLDIYGKAENADKVNLFLNGDPKYTIDANEGIFTYKILGLGEQKYTLIAQSTKGEQTSIYSEPVTFTVDRTGEQFTAKDFSFVTNQEGKLQLNLTRGELRAVKLTYNGIVSDMYQNDLKTWVSDIKFEKNDVFYVEAIDLAGNIATSEIKVIEITNYVQASSIFPELSIQNQVNILVIGLIILILSADLFYIHKHQKEGYGYKHLHIGLLLVLIIIIVVNQISGNILTGIHL